MKLVLFGDLIEANGKSIRENNSAITHGIPLGTLVEAKWSEWHGNGACEKIHARMFVTGHLRDCDGTPLYEVAKKPRDQWGWDGYPEHFVRLVMRAMHGLTEDALTPIRMTDDG